MPVYYHHVLNGHSEFSCMLLSNNTWPIFAEFTFDFCCSYDCLIVLCAWLALAHYLVCTNGFYLRSLSFVLLHTVCTWCRISRNSFVALVAESNYTDAVAESKLKSLAQRPSTLVRCKLIRLWESYYQTMKLLVMAAFASFRSCLMWWTKLFWGYSRSWLPRIKLDMCLVNFPESKVMIVLLLMFPDFSVIFNLYI
jgi:hypothetical protein